MTDPCEIKDFLDDTANILTQALLTVGELRGWVVYFLEALEAETQNRAAYEELLADLVTDINLRLDNGRW
jgi:hypothetical protein